MKNKRILLFCLFWGICFLGMTMGQILGASLGGWGEGSAVEKLGRLPYLGNLFTAAVIAGVWYFVTLRRGK